MTSKEQEYKCLIFAGVDGGSTKTDVVLMQADGKILAKASGPNTNQWAMCLSGADGIGVQQQMRQKFCDTYDQLHYQHVVVFNDSRSSIAASSPTGGMVLIAGTGTNCEYWNGELQAVGEYCGGWGHMLGDQGSAYWIAHYCLKYFIKVEQSFCANDQDYHSVKYVKKVIYEYFQISEMLQLLPFLYTNFSKAKIAGLCKLFAKGATEGDSLCIHVFNRAGQMLARHLKAIFSNNEDIQNEITVVCVGSVWKSMDLLKQGFSDELTNAKNLKVHSIHLVSLKVACVNGSAYIASKAIGEDVQVDYSNNVTPLFTLRL